MYQPRAHIRGCGVPGSGDDSSLCLKHGGPKTWKTGVGVIPVQQRLLVFLFFPLFLSIMPWGGRQSGHRVVISLLSHVLV